MANKELTLGSLFDGSGGFPLGGILAGIKPVFSSEIEPFSIRVTEKRLPEVKHYGDVNKLNGADLPPVDIITGGFPCTDVSIAGKREGLYAQRTGLFFQFVRIVKEMRCKSNGKYPRYLVAENVTGLFSSAKGEDFRTVLEEICKIKDCEVHFPRPAKWENAGEILGDDFSVAWRVFDSARWGVPQRRKRIYFVADFDGTSAGKILFESEGLSRYSAESFKSWQAAAGSVTQGTGATVKICLNDQGGNRMDITNEMTSTLRAEAHHPPVVMESAGFCTEHSAKSRSIGYEKEMSPTLRAGVVPAAVCFENHSQDTRYRQLGDIAPTVSANYGMGGNNQPFVVEKTYDVRLTSEGTKNARQNVYETDTARTVDTGGIPPDANQGGIAVVEAYGICSKDSNAMKSENPNSGIYKAETSRTLDTSNQLPNKNQGGIAVVAVEGNGTRPSHHGNGYSEEGVGYTLNTTEQHGVAYGIDRATYNMGQNAQYAISIQEEVEPTIVAKGPGAVAHPTYCTSKSSFHTTAEKELANTLVASDYKDPPTVNDTDDEMEYIVRRLTPTECARLQGFPDWWCSELASENPTDEKIAKWREIFKEYDDALGKKTKPKTDNQIRKWLQNPHSDSAEYKMWGNGVSLPVVFFVLAGIKWAVDENIS